jgi:hypothetical protein
LKLGTNYALGSHVGATGSLRIEKQCNLIIFAVTANMAGRISRQSRSVRGFERICGNEGQTQMTAAVDRFMRIILMENAVFISLNTMISLAYPGFRAKNLNRPLWSNLIRPAAWGRAAYPEALTAPKKWKDAADVNFIISMRDSEDSFILT